MLCASLNVEILIVLLRVFAIDLNVRNSEKVVVICLVLLVISLALINYISYYMVYPVWYMS
jgi:hypothetical protein